MQTVADGRAFYEHRLGSAYCIVLVHVATTTSCTTPDEKVQTPHFSLGLSHHLPLLQLLSLFLLLLGALLSQLLALRLTQLRFLLLELLAQTLFLLIELMYL